ncbi:tRNA threonylcarbamoyladenosine biosynthesis protein TsaE [Serratia symbiotica]|nr:tRNA threonylcarbamoyladenosine biosynthesis protein TsaE [Serratia symbiotica]
MKANVLPLTDEEATVAIGYALAKICDRTSAIYLHGDLDAGKSTFCRGFLQYLGYQGIIERPTFTLVKRYTLHPLTLYHFVLYRLADPNKLQFIGICDYFMQNVIYLVKWAQQGWHILPKADLSLYLSYYNQGSKAKIQAMSSYGNQLIARIYGQ